MPTQSMRHISLFVVLGLSIVISNRAEARPKISDPAGVTITLERSACFGTCPDYKVTIHGDGRVVFTTETDPIDPADALHSSYFAQTDGVLLVGTHEDRIPVSDVTGLIQKFQDANFWALRASYVAAISDNPTYRVTFDTGQSHKTVTDYVGNRVGMPRRMTDLENAIDQVARTGKWVDGTPDLLDWLERTQFDFRSEDAAELAAAAAFRDGTEKTVLGLIARGAPLDSRVEIGSTNYLSVIIPPNAAGSIIFESAVRRGNVDLFRYMVSAGWLDRVGRARAAQVFVVNSAACSPTLVDAFAEAGIDIDTTQNPTPKADPDDLDDPQGQTALSKLGGAFVCEDNETDRVKTAERLLAHGANPNHRDSLGQTPLYGVENLDLLNLLLDHGADATVKDNSGQSTVFGSWADPIVLRLLEAGASPVGRYDYDGKTLAEHVKISKMKRVGKWLAAHPEAFSR